MENKQLSVLFVVNQLIYGGAERYTVNVANEVVKRGGRAVVISRGGPMLQLLSKKVRHYYAPVRKTDILNRIRTILTILYVSRKEKSQIVHTQSTSGALAAKIAGIFTKVPVIKTAHGYPDGRFPSVARALNLTTDKVIMISDWLSRRLIGFGLRKEKAITVLNGIDIAKFSKVSVDKDALRKRIGLDLSDKVIISVSRVVPEKQFEHLIYWFPFVLAKIPNAKLLVVGDGGADGEEYRETLIKQVKDAGLDKSILFLRGTHKIAPLLKISNVFCTPSVGKGFAVLEAMAASLPVVARKPRGVSDTVIDGVTGFNFAINDWKNMAEKLIALLESDKFAKKIGGQGKILVSSRFTQDQMIDKLGEIYNSLIKLPVKGEVKEKLTPSQKMKPSWTGAIFEPTFD